MSAYLLVGLAVFIVISIISTGTLFWATNRSPHGYEDKDGFHYGDEP